MVLSVQYLRGIAAAMVLLEHIALKSSQYSTGVLSGWHVGGAGVDLFFLISGFIMCHTMAHKHQQVGAARTFLWRRVLRIIPLYWIVTCLALTAYVLMPSQVNSSGGSTDLFASFFLLPTSGVYLVANGWTLSYEFLFYGLFTLGLLFSRSVGSLLVVTLLMMLALFGFAQPQTSVWGMFLTNQLLIEFAAGMGLCYFLKQINRLPPMMMPMLIGTGLGALLAVNQGIRTDVRVIDYGVPMLLIMAGALGLEGSLRQAPSRLLNALGDSSYAMYLIHPFVLVVGAKLMSKFGLSATLNGWFFVGFLYIASIVSGWLLFRYVETTIANSIKKQSFAASKYQVQQIVNPAVDS
ncbi:acyltransferase [Leucothrix sargassi]|nr:acyltransferase [Leucothrix sargassi]